MKGSKQPREGTPWGGPFFVAAWARRLCIDPGDDAPHPLEVTALPGARGPLRRSTRPEGQDPRHQPRLLLLRPRPPARDPNDNPILNTVRAGSSVPVKFGLRGYQGMSIHVAGSPASKKIACDSGAPLDGIEETVTTGGSGLCYDPTSDQYTYVWKSDKAWAGSCRQLVVTLSEGTEHPCHLQVDEVVGTR